MAASIPVILGLAVASVNPRAGGSGSLMLALFAFIVYYNLINLGQSWIANGATHWVRHLVVLHGSVALGSLVLMMARQGSWHWRLWPTRGAA